MYSESNVDNITLNGSQLYAKNKLHVLDRYSMGYNAESFNKMSDRFIFKYDTFKDAINLSIRGDLLEYSNPKSEISNNIASFKLSLKI